MAAVKKDLSATVMLNSCEVNNLHGPIRMIKVYLKAVAKLVEMLIQSVHTLTVRRGGQNRYDKKETSVGV